MHFYFITISSLSFFPVFKYILQSIFNTNYFPQKNIYLIESHLSGFPDYSNVVNAYFFSRFSSIEHFNNMSFITKIKRYIWAVFFILHARIKKNAILYTCDYQVLFILFKILRILGKSNIRVIYHQYELIENSNPRKILQKIKENKHLIDLVILPEINRLNYFINNCEFDFQKTLLFPNTCNVNNDFTLKHHYLNNFNEDDIIIAHIGNIGLNHFFENFIQNFLNANLPVNYKLIFIGKQSSQIAEYLKSKSFTNIYFFNEVPHNELSSIYNYIDLGLILYKPIDLNFDYCAPNKLYEYWAHGVPVLAHPLSGLKNIVTENLGMLIDINNFKKEKFLNISKLQSSKRNLIKNEFQHNFGVDKFQKELEGKIKHLNI